MMISTKGRYALRVVADLAEHGNGDFTPLKDIAERQDISLKYLESIMVVLSRAGFVSARHGKGGGYKLNRHPGSYTVGSILKLTERSLAPVACLECSPNQCVRAKDCKTLPLWTKLDCLIDRFLESMTVEDLINRSEPGHNNILYY